MLIHWGFSESTVNSTCPRVNQTCPRSSGCLPNHCPQLVHNCTTINTSILLPQWHFGQLFFVSPQIKKTHNSCQRSIVLNTSLLVPPTYSRWTVGPGTIQALQWIRYQKLGLHGWKNSPMLVELTVFPEPWINFSSWCKSRLVCLSFWNGWLSWLPAYFPNHPGYCQGFC